MITCENLIKTYRVSERTSWFRAPSFRKIPALQGVSFSIPKGEIVGLLGPNGAGKTSLLKILSTLLLPDDGKAFLAGKDVVSNTKFARQKLGLVLSSDRSLYWKLTGLENLIVYGGLYNLPSRGAKERSIKLITVVGLQEFTHVAVEKYSTGMRKRLMIARALLHHPSVLILDEPSSGLDVQGKRELWMLLKEVSRAEEVTTLFATHDMEEAEQLPERLILIHNGTLHADGTPKEIKSRAGQESLVILEFPDITLPELQNSANFEKTETGYRLTVYTSNPVSEIPELLRRYPQAIRLERKEPKLGDAFLSLTGATLAENNKADEDEE
jgi:ABC-2 type transport system ATP-binding protein